jgi:His/Glu/Gln/Arg/opine family amino acid ABC transporter permease subunit
MSFGNIFYKTLIDGGSYLTILRGLRVTMEISLLSVLIGTALGALVCAARMCKNRPVQGLAVVYIAVLRGSPVLLLLMLMYYVVFARSNLSAPLIAVVAFSLNVSAHVAECFRAAYSATDKMQAEAARTLGFSKWQAFRLISLPQAAKIAKPTYQSTLVNLIQWTSVVGYVTITDLTRVINNIGSRTMQPLFMILVGMLLYLALAYLCYGFFALTDTVSGNKAERRHSQ